MVRKAQTGQPRGRSGGRAGGAGYDFQDIYIALQLAKLLVGDREKPVEVLWEKKAVDWGHGAEPLHVDDVIISRANGKKIYVQVKETAPAREWSTSELLRSGVFTQFWREWHSKSSDDRETTVLRLASGGSVAPLNLLVDVARRARTPRELLSDEASAEVEEDIIAISKALSLDPTDLTLLDFIKSIEAEQLPSAKELEGWILQCLVAAGESAVILSNRLVRLVSQSKHAGASARSAFTQESLLEALREDGVADDILIAIGAIRVQPLTDISELYPGASEAIIRKLRKDAEAASIQWMSKLWQETVVTDLFDESVFIGPGTTLYYFFRSGLIQKRNLFDRHTIFTTNALVTTYLEGEKETLLNHVEIVGDKFLPEYRCYYATHMADLPSVSSSVIGIAGITFGESGFNLRTCWEEQVDTIRNIMLKTQKHIVILGDAKKLAITEGSSFISWDDLRNSCEIIPGKRLSVLVNSDCTPDFSNRFDEAKRHFTRILGRPDFKQGIHRWSYPAQKAIDTPTIEPSKEPI